MKQLKITTKITSRDSFSIDKYLSEISKLPMLSEECKYPQNRDWLKFGKTPKFN